MPRLSDPISLNGVVARNRLVLPPITVNFGSLDGEVTADTLGFYRQRSRHVGLVVVEATAVRPDGRIGPPSLGLWNDRLVDGMTNLSGTVKSEGAVALVQINHAGARSVPVDGGIRGASPSGVRFRPDTEPTVLSPEQIEEIESDFVRAAVRARAAGFDGVEVHAAHYYLLSQFLSPLTNLREDRYGGDASGRATMAVEVVKAIRKAVGTEFIVGVRVNAVEVVEGGQSVEDARSVARMLEAAGATVIHSSLIASGGWAEVNGTRVLQGRSALAKDQERGGALVSASEIRNAVNIPVIGVGKLGAAEARSAVSDGLVDMAALGRQMIADPDTAGKILEDRDGEVVLCRECWGCFNSIGKGGRVVCSTNRNLPGKPEYLPLR